MKRVRILTIFFLLAGLAQAQEWELGVAGGFGFARNPTVTSASGSGNAGFKHGLTAGAVAGNDMYERISGEMHYLYRVSNLKVTGGGQQAESSGEAHLIHYDLLYHAADRGAKVRPFLAGGGGLKVFRGTGSEPAGQPAGAFALLMRTRELEPLISAGGGVKVALTDTLHLRAEIRDYITPFPKKVVAPAPAARIKGWLHDFVPTVGISVKF